jgi:ribosomal protein S18 acetylase RimI-like enzyme
VTPDPASVMDAGSAYLAEINRRVAGFDGLVEPDITLSAIGLPFARVNSAHGARLTPESVESRIDDVIAWFEARGLPFVWRIGPADRPTTLQHRLVARGFVLDPDTMPGMVAALVNLPALELPAGTSLETVTEPAAFRAWLDVTVAGFGMPPQLGDAFMKFAGLGFGEDAPTSLLARIDGRPAAAALVTVAGGGAVISNVTTLPAARGRGLGRAITLAGMRHAAEAGAAIAVLQSSEMGYGIYRRLGFETFGWYGACIRRSPAPPI